MQVRLPKDRSFIQCVMLKTLESLFLHFSSLFGNQIVLIDYNSLVPLKFASMYFTLTSHIKGVHGLSLPIEKLVY